MWTEKDLFSFPYPFLAQHCSAHAPTSPLGGHSCRLTPPGAGAGSGSQSGSFPAGQPLWQITKKLGLGRIAWISAINSWTTVAPACKLSALPASGLCQPLPFTWAARCWALVPCKETPQGFLLDIGIESKVEKLQEASSRLTSQWEHLCISWI